MSDAAQPRPYCALPPQPVPVLPPDMPADRQRAIIVGATKWVNGTALRYHFLDGPDAERDVVRQMLQAWKDLPIGLSFAEADDPAEAEIRIGFDQGDGSWSYIGRGVLDIGARERTMNFGWDLTTPYGHTTALHEIGHTLGLPHEHQNPFAGIVWDEPRVYAYFAGPPNNWPRETTFHNVLRKLSRGEVEGSEWDPDSIMEYAFPAGLITAPEEYRDGIDPPGVLSAIDKQWARQWYPAERAGPIPLTPFQSVPLALAPSQQADFTIAPPSSRRYEIGTFGTADTLIVLFEDVDSELRFLAGDDDSGMERNARLSVRLLRGRRYVLRVRLYWAGESGQMAAMYW